MRFPRCSAVWRPRRSCLEGPRCWRAAAFPAEAPTTTKIIAAFGAHGVMFAMGRNSPLASFPEADTGSVGSDQPVIVASVLNRQSVDSANAAVVSTVHGPKKGSVSGRQTFGRTGVGTEGSST
jgi:hypothetical protein